MPTTSPAKTSGKTAAGKAISARNATTHGLFCRQTVLPHLGEDPAGYQKLLDTLHQQLRPRNLMERQYLELWADASWKLRRLSRLEAQVWEDDHLDGDDRLTRLERLARLQTGLRRQLDRAVKMLSRELPHLFAHRTREDVMEKLSLTETLCAENPFRQKEVERAVQANTHWPPPTEDFTDGLDNTVPPPAVPDPAQAPAPDCPDEKCQNELPEAPEPEEERQEPEESGDVPERDAPLSPRAQRRQRLQALEDLVNSGTLTPEQRRSILMSEDIPGFSAGNGRITIHKK